MNPARRTPDLGHPVRARRGAALVEFALVSLVLYLLLAAIIGIGRWMLVAQSTQEAARVAAREIALYPLPAGFNFAQALADPGFQGAVYDADFLVVDLDATPPGPDLENFFDAMPVVNRALRPLMITSNVDVGGVIRRLQHVPGVVTNSATSPTGLTVVVPRIDMRDATTGEETAITLVDVLEEVRPDAADPTTGSFSVTSAERGLVAVRLNIPFQSAMLTAYVPGIAGNQPIVATDPVGGGNEIVGPGPDGTGPYSGTFGLGEQFALGQTVRPFRRLVTAQALFRREVFQ